MLACEFRKIRPSFISIAPTPGLPVAERRPSFRRRVYTLGCSRRRIPSDDALTRWPVPRLRPLWPVRAQLTGQRGGDSVVGTARVRGMRIAGTGHVRLLANASLSGMGSLGCSGAGSVGARGCRVRGAGAGLALASPRVTGDARSASGSLSPVRSVVTGVHAPIKPHQQKMKTKPWKRTVV